MDAVTLALAKKYTDELATNKSTATIGQVLASNGDGTAKFVDSDTLGYDINSWQDVQRIVRQGVASKIFVVGDQFSCTRGADTLIWDILGFDIDVPYDVHFTHSMTLGLRKVYKSLQFSAPQATYYAATEVAAGDYYVSTNSKNYQFTLAQTIPAGGQARLVVADMKIYTYASKTTSTIRETATVTEGTTGTQLTPVNDYTRTLYGSNNYENSALRQWINSSAAAGSVWTPKTNYDRPPSWVSTEAGFLNGLDADFLTVIGEAKKVTAKNTVTDGGGSVEITTDKFFLLSRYEVFGSKENSISEGTYYPYYSAFTSSPSDAALAGRIKYNMSNSASPWWLRSPFASYSISERLVFTDGSLYYGNANGSYGVAPACAII